MSVSEFLFFVNFPKVDVSEIDWKVSMVSEFILSSERFPSWTF